MNTKLLLENVVQGKQTEIEEILIGNETLALERGIVTDHSNRSFNLSAIQYATWAFDTDMLEALVKNLTPDQKIQAAQQMEDLEKNPAQYSQYGANSEPIILNLIKELKNYPAEESEESRCSRIGGAQRGLPINVINEYCNPLHHQKKSPDKLPRGIQVCIYHKVEQSMLYQSSFSGVPCFPSEESGLGREFFLSALWPKYPLYLSGTLGQGVRNTTPQIINDDIHNLNELLKSRKSKILEIINLLKGTPVLKKSEEKIVASPLPFSTAIRKPQKEFVIKQPELPDFLRTTKCDYQFFNSGTSSMVDQLTKDMMNISLNTKLEEGDEKILDADPMQSVEPPKEPSKKIANKKPTKILSQKTENFPNKPKMSAELKTSVYERFVPGLNYQQIDGDGNCLYSAVALYLGTDSKKLREKVANYLEKNLTNTDIISVVEGLLPENQTIEEYISAIKNSVQWADGVEIAVLMEILNRPIIILGIDRQIRNTHEIAKFNGEPIFVLYNGHTHYDALLLDGSKSANTLLIEFQKKQNPETSNFRFPAANNPYSIFTSHRLTLGTLLQRAEISFKNVLDKPIVEIKFFELEYAKYFQSELMERQITDSNFPEKPRKIQTPQKGEYDFNLRPEEYYAISGDESVIDFGSKSFFGSGR